MSDLREHLLSSALYETLKAAREAVFAFTEIMEGDPKCARWDALLAQTDAVLARAEREVVQ